MGTRNFANVENVSCIYPIFLNIVEEEIGEEYSERTWELYEIEKFKENLIDTLCDIDPANFIDVDTNFSSYNNHYNRTSLGRFDFDHSIGEINFSVSLVPYWTTGYYEGASLDVAFFYEGQEYDSIEDIVHDIISWSIPDNPGLHKIHSKYVQPYIENTFNTMIAKIEEVYTRFSDYKLKLIGTASNGEGFYEKCKS
jgi:hypothetical protein